ncbi:hypothetical protein [Paenibacillus paeoniae]|uniref:hypothetical protein n=1 Tax=Paenibacillus paeoniae TaxID=2292705 RepID=UPI001401E1BF|nr:hypothetical protein [Paenibacillus paeoniae]
MDKRQVIAAYRRGFLTIQECAQIIGVDSRQAAKIADDANHLYDSSNRLEQPAVKSQ